MKQLATPAAAGILMTLALFATTSAAPSSAKTSEKKPLEVGQPFPELVLPDLDGQPKSIASFRGRPLVLHVFASW